MPRKATGKAKGKKEENDRAATAETLQSVRSDEAELPHTCENTPSNEAYCRSVEAEIIQRCTLESHADARKARTTTEDSRSASSHTKELAEHAPRESNPPLAGEEGQSSLVRRGGGRLLLGGDCGKNDTEKKEGGGSTPSCTNHDACFFAQPPSPPSPVAAASDTRKTAKEEKHREGTPDGVSLDVSTDEALMIGPESVSEFCSCSQIPKAEPLKGGVSALTSSSLTRESVGGEEISPVYTHAREILAIAVPVALGNLSEYLPLTFGMIMVGNLPGAAQELDALAMANSYFNITGLAIQYGLNSALRTLCPQAVGSGRGRELNGIYVQRGVLVGVLALAPSFAFAFNAQRILVLLGQPADLALLAQEYCIRLQPALVGIGLMTLLQRVMQADGHIMANLYICLLVFACAPPIQYLLIHHLGFGFLGGAYASSAYNMLYILFYIPYMYMAGLGHIFIPRKEALSLAGMRGHLSLALPGLVSTLLEWASMELVLIVAGTRPSSRLLLGALGVMLNLEAVFAMCWVGFMVAIFVKVGQELGGGRADKAKSFALVGVAVSFCSSLVVCVLLFVFRREIVLGYTSRAESTAAISDTAVGLVGPLVLLIMFNSMNCSIQGVMSGAGLQHVTAVCSLVAWYMVAAPLAFGLIWGLDLDVAAGDVLLLACAAAMAVAFVGQAIALLRFDWSKAVHAAAARLDAAIPDANSSASRGRRQTSSTGPISIGKRRAASLSPKPSSPSSTFNASPLPPHAYSFAVRSTVHAHFSPPKVPAFLAPCALSACFSPTGNGKRGGVSRSAVVGGGS